MSKDLDYNRQQIERLARRMRREISQRIDRGDTLRVCWAADQLIAAAPWKRDATIADLLDWLAKCDADHWLNMVMVYWASEKVSAALKIASGYSRQEWLEMERRTCRLSPEY